MREISSIRIALTGAAGLVGQNLIVRPKSRGDRNIVALDKHKANIAILRPLHPDITAIACDLARDEGWQAACRRCEGAPARQFAPRAASGSATAASPPTRASSRALAALAKRA
jgi:nucleoside-diphosphate-sugar epimerase